MDFPKASEGVLPTVYDKLDDGVERAEGIIRDQFEVEDHGEVEVILWEQATEADFAEAMYADPEVMMEFFKKLTGLPAREFDRVYGLDDLDRIKGWTQKDLRESERGRAFAAAIDDVLPDEMYMETALYTFYLMWENDQRRHVRSNYENVVLDDLEEEGIPAKKDESLPGKPDLVVPHLEPYKVLGEVRSMHRKDFRKRSKNFDSEATKAKKAFPGVKFVVVAKFPPHQVEEEGEYLRSEIEAINDHIDAVYFDGEIEAFVDQLEEWGVERRETGGSSE